MKDAPWSTPFSESFTITDTRSFEVQTAMMHERALLRSIVRRAHRAVQINNAGFAGIGVTEAYTVEQFQQIFDVNVYGAVRVNRAVLPYMRRRRSGLLIHVSSAAGRVTVPAMAPYCASKFALEAIADAYRFELLPFGIDSVLVEPGIYRTPIFDKLQSPADAERLADYGTHGEYAGRVLGTFQAAIGAPDAPGSAEIAEVFVQLVEAEPARRPFRTVVSPAIKPLVEPYNAAAEALRPVVAQISTFRNWQVCGLPPLRPNNLPHSLACVRICLAVSPPSAARPPRIQITRSTHTLARNVRYRTARDHAAAVSRRLRR